MDEIIRTISEILKVTDKKISDLLVLSKHKIDESSTYGSRMHSTLSSFEIISPPIQTAKLNALNDEEKQKVHNAVLMIFPLKENAPEITEIIFIADPSLSKDIEFIQYIRDEELINDISIVLNLLERKPPKFWRDFKNGKLTSLLEDDFRSEFYRMLGMKYQIGSEEESKVGRTDLIIKSTSLNRKIFEFKVWSRNNYRKSSTQLLQYLTEIDDIGIIIMCNSNKVKSIAFSDYECVIKSPEYFPESIKNMDMNIL